MLQGATEDAKENMKFVFILVLLIPVNPIPQGKCIAESFFVIGKKRQFEGKLVT